MACDCSAEVNHFSHAESTAGAEIQTKPFSWLQSFERLEVRNRQIIHMDVVANASSIWCWIIIAANDDVSSLAECDLQRGGDEMSFRSVVLAQISIRTGTGCVEVPKCGIGEAVSVCVFG